jgi:hypothetical protein
LRSAMARKTDFMLAALMDFKSILGMAVTSQRSIGLLASLYTEFEILSISVNSWKGR